MDFGMRLRMNRHGEMENEVYFSYGNGISFMGAEIVSASAEVSINVDQLIADLHSPNPFEVLKFKWVRITITVCHFLGCITIHINHPCQQNAASGPASLSAVAAFIALGSGMGMGM